MNQNINPNPFHQTNPLGWPTDHWAVTTCLVNTDLLLWPLRPMVCHARDQPPLPPPPRPLSWPKGSPIDQHVLPRVHYVYARCLSRIFKQGADGVDWAITSGLYRKPWPTIDSVQILPRTAGLMIVGESGDLVDLHITKAWFITFIHLLYCNITHEYFISSDQNYHQALANNFGSGMTIIGGGDTLQSAWMAEIYSVLLVLCIILYISPDGWMPHCI